MIQMVFRMDDNLEGYTVRFYHVWDENTQTFVPRARHPLRPHDIITCLWGRAAGPGKDMEQLPW